ncbi:aldehyde dehydrogenase family protein [Oxalobacteraceae bacterium CAVE-383]|nr:aldehyde dehydrogenase family protein [Oxalobacteraceae bacterium CAVE-383]
MHNATPIKIDLFINQKAVAGDHYFEVRDPGNFAEVVGLVAAASAKDVDDAVTAAYRAGHSWRNAPVRERLDRLLAAAGAMEIMGAQLAETLVREQGILLAETVRDAANGVQTLRETVAIAEPFLQDETFEDGETLIRLEKAPIGVVAAIIPWNAPLGLAMTKVGPALACGNTLVLKPSPFAPIALSQALQLIAGFFPPGVVNIVNGDGECGPALTRHPLVRKVSFTGSVPVGKAVMAAAAESVKNIGLELGGNDPAIILDDARPADVVPELIRRIFPRSGQVCYAVKRIYVPQALHDKFHGALYEAIDQLQVGYGMDPRSTLAPVNNKNQFNFIKGLLERTRAGGATVSELGGKVDPASWDKGYYLRPALISNVAPDAEVVTCEQFGPIIPLVPYRTEDEAIQMANSTEHGLASSVWTGDFERGMQLAKRIEAGLTFVNSHARTALGDRHLPFGGVKQSGIGRVRTTIGMAEYIEHHAISLNKNVIADINKNAKGTN